MREVQSKRERKKKKGRARKILLISFEKKSKRDFKGEE